MNKLFSVESKTHVRIRGFYRYSVGSNNQLTFSVLPGKAVIWPHPLKPFCWDGCSPKLRFFGKMFGTPDGRTKNIYHNPINPIPPGKPETYWASLVHDAAYSCKGNLRRIDADKMFLELLQQQKFKYAKLYYMGVRLFGWIWWVT